MTLYKRGKSNVWWMNIMVLGKRIRKSCKTTDKLLAAQIMDRFISDAYGNSHVQIRTVDKLNMTLRVAANITLDEHFSKLSSATTTSYCVEKIVKIIGPSTKLSEISEVTFYLLKRFLKNEGASDCTVKKYYSNFNRILKHVKKYYGVKCFSGFQDEFMIKSPSRIRTISESEEEIVRTWFSNANKLRETWGNQDLVEILDVLFATGMRRGECFSFTASQVEENVIIFQPNQHKAGRHAGPKSVCLNARARDVILNRIERYQIKPGERVFPYSPVAFTRLWGHMREDMGLAHDKEFVPNAIRHTFASRLIAKGASIYDVSKLLGHTNVSTTERYAHMFTSRLVQVVSLLD